MNKRSDFDQLFNFINQRPWIGICFLVVLAILYSLRALLAPFWVGNDAWSNLLPIIHFRDSILNNHSLPLYTDLWYGGRYQWANPLWSFLYLPATLIQLALPLDWGIRVIYLGHLIFILIAARKLASLFFDTEIEKLASAIILTAPILPAFTAGQNEKIMSWGWVLLAVFFLLNGKLSLHERGIGAGICLGIVPLTGSNYYALYLGMSLLLLIPGYKEGRLFAFFILGSLIGLLHAPSVLHLIGQERGNPETSISLLSISVPGLLSSISIGIAEPVGWETWSPIGIPLVYIFFRSILLNVKSLINKQIITINHQQKALMLTLLPFTLLATGAAYQAIPMLSLFRVPSRVLPFIALTVALFSFFELSNHKNARHRNLYLLTSAFQLCIFSYMIKPYGALYSPYDPQAQHAASILKADGAQQVWISMHDNLNDMYIQVSLNLNGIGLPNVYYGDMGQTIKIDGSYCGYSFDHLIAPPPAGTQAINLTADIEWSDAKGRISLGNMVLIQHAPINGIIYNFYRIICEEQ